MHFGLFSTGELTIESMKIAFETNETSIGFILTCISTGGPVTTVTWTRSYYNTVTEGTETVLDDRGIAQYSTTLTVNETSSYNIYRYSCEVSNNKPSSVTLYTTIDTFTAYGM